MVSELYAYITTTTLTTDRGSVPWEYYVLRDGEPLAAAKRKSRKSRKSVHNNTPACHATLGGAVVCCSLNAAG